MQEQIPPLNPSPEELVDTAHNRSRWQWLARLAPGQSTIPLADGRNEAHVTANRLGFRIRTRTLANGDFIITRLH